MSVGIIDEIRWGQDVEMLVWIGENVLERFSFVVSSDEVVGPDAIQFWVNFNNISTVLYWMGGVPSFQCVWCHNLENYPGTWCPGGLSRRVSQERRRALKMLLVKISKEFCLARRNAVRELSSICSRVLSVMRRLHLREFVKTKLSLDLSKWLEWKSKSAAQSTGFLHRHVLCTGLWRLFGHMWIFMSRTDISWLEWSRINLILGWMLFIKSFIDWDCLVVPRKIRKMSSMKLFQRGIDQRKASQINFWKENCSNKTPTDLTLNQLNQIP